jgi:hypothetical protein
MKPTLEIDCEKHGRQLAIPLIDGRLSPHDEWPKNVESFPRVCVRCVAEHMVSPIRRRGGDSVHRPIAV